MNRGPKTSASPDSELSVQAYLLGLVDFESALALQRRLVYQVAGDRDQAALVVCEHPPLITVGRHGSRRHILDEPADLRSRRWEVRWVNRGGGCQLHLPGQMAIYAIVALDRHGLDVPQYLARLQAVLIAVLRDFGIAAQACPGEPGVSVGGRTIAQVGVAVHDWVTYYGAVLNVNPDPVSLRRVRGLGESDAVTTLVRERRGPLRTSMVRERLVEYFAERFGFVRTSIFFDHPSLRRRTPSDALAASS